MKVTKTRWAVIATAVLSAGLVSSPATARPAPAPDPVRAQMLAQQPLIAAADIVKAEAETTAGFAGLVLEDSHVELWWKGEVPDSVTAAVERASEVAPVTVSPARYTNAELRDAAKTVDASRGLGSPVHAVKIPADGSGLVLGAYPWSDATAFTASLHVDVPVTVVHEEPLRPVSRRNDGPPWKGGATIVLGNAACTSGFSVRNGNNDRFLLTAAHCGNPGQRVTDPTGEYIGTVSVEHSDHDIMLIPTGNVTSQMYVGGGDSNSVETVRGWGDVYTNEILCQSGVTSAGETGNAVCNIKVLFFYADREDLVEGEQMNGQPAARPGDSGGPVYGPSSAGGVIAKGTVTRTAGSRIGFQDFRTASRDFGVYMP